VLLDDEVARAVLTESAPAVQYQWGVSHGVVQRWRKALGVNRVNNPRTHQRVKESGQAGADAIKPKDWTKGEVQAKREDAPRLYLGRLKVSSLPCRLPPAAFASCSQPLPRNGS
jgi:hypothetical protein